jgi:S1-C subfamily serine protease
MWMVLVLAVLTAGGIITNGILGGRDDRPPRVATPKSYLEVDGFETSDGGGAFIEGLRTSNTSLERAGLRGGDTITSWDGKPIANERAMLRAIAATPVGKPVEVIFRRDGVMGKTTLTTVSEADFSDTLAGRPEGRGFLGVDDMERVHVPSTNTHGVELGDVHKNRPGYIAGLREGDIIMEFNGKPVSTPGDLTLRIYEALPDSVVDVVLMRGGQQMKIPVRMGAR